VEVLPVDGDRPEYAGNRQVCAGAKICCYFASYARCHDGGRIGIGKRRKPVLKRFSAPPSAPRTVSAFIPGARL